MKALTLIQPWATLIMEGRKKIETRSWPTKIRGIIAIHAGQKIDRMFAEDANYDPAILPTGVILGTVELIDCFQFTHKIWEQMIDTDEDKFGDITPGRYGFKLENPKSYSNPIPAKGALGFWNWEQ